MSIGHATDHQPGVVSLVDGDAGAREALSRLLQHTDWQVRSFASARDFMVRRALQRDAIQLREHERLGELRRRVASLSPREREVTRRVVRGVLNKTIAAELDIAEITVKVHRRHVMDKMGAGSLAELVRMVDRAEPGLGD